MTIDYSILNDEVVKVLRPKGNPVGVKLRVNKSELDRFRAVKPRRQLALCQVLKLSSIYGKTIYAEGKDIDACAIGTYILGFSDLPSDLMERWVKTANYAPEVFKAFIERIHVLPKGKYNALICSSLATFNVKEFEPNLIFIPVNSTQAYLLLMGYFDATGDKPSSDFNGHAACEIIAAALNKDKPWLTIPCGGARSIAEVQDDELWIAMRPEHLNSALKLLKSRGLKYPPPLPQMLGITPDPEHPVTFRIRR